MCTNHGVQEVIVVFPESSFVVSVCFSCDALRLRPVTAADARVLPIVGSPLPNLVVPDDFALAA